MLGVKKETGVCLLPLALIVAFILLGHFVYSAYSIDCVKFLAFCTIRGFTLVANDELDQAVLILAIL